MKVTSLAHYGDINETMGRDKRRMLVSRSAGFLKVQETFAWGGDKLIPKLRQACRIKYKQKKRPDWEVHTLNALRSFHHLHSLETSLLLSSSISIASLTQLWPIFLCSSSSHSIWSLPSISRPSIQFCPQLSSLGYHEPRSSHWWVQEIDCPSRNMHPASDQILVKEHFCEFSLPPSSSIAVLT